MNRSSIWQLDLGACPVGPSRVRFRVWAPRARRVAVRLIGQARAPVAMAPCGGGYFEAEVVGVEEGARYFYVLDQDRKRPDPASRLQPAGVHGPSAVVNLDAFGWTDQAWTGIPREQLIVYELHVGTFTRAGTFQAIVPFLDYLRDEVGVTAIELMPVAQFPGTRNWGYDGVQPFAPQVSYGGPEGLMTLVDACHAKGLGVILDVVYNHLGPEGNYLDDFGPYFTDRYHTPWGRAFNYDGPDSAPVRHYVISNALYWVTSYHLDGLRLDAIHGIVDAGPSHILRDLAEAVGAEAGRLGRSVVVTAESDLNETRPSDPVTEGGYGLDALWNDDFHHALHALLTGERTGYYQDFGQMEHLVAALQDGFVLSGQWSAYRRRRHGTSSCGCPPDRFMVFAQNHDQVGNRAGGDRLSTLVPFEALKVAAASVLLAPHLPLLFMGEEYGERAPFLYFTDHGDPGLVEAVCTGRRAEFAAFNWQSSVPDPQDPETFVRSCLTLGGREDGQPRMPSEPLQRALLRWYRRLIDLRRSLDALGASDSSEPRHRVTAYPDEQVLTMHRWGTTQPAALLILGFNRMPVALALAEPEGRWRLALDASADEFGGPGQPAAPSALAIGLPGASLTLQAFSVLLYLADVPEPRSRTHVQGRADTCRLERLAQA